MNIVRSWTSNVDVIQEIFGQSETINESSLDICARRMRWLLVFGTHIYNFTYFSVYSEICILLFTHLNPGMVQAVLYGGPVPGDRDEVQDILCEMMQETI